MFGEDSYTVVTAATTSTSRYELIEALAEPRKANSGHVLLMRNGSLCRGYLSNILRGKALRFFGIWQKGSIISLKIS